MDCTIQPHCDIESINIRAYIATKMAAGILGTYNGEKLPPKVVASRAVAFADALIRELNVSNFDEKTMETANSGAFAVWPEDEHFQTATKDDL